MSDGAHVLILEDDRITSLVISEFLAAHGYRTTVSSNGVEGVSQFLSDRPDLVLCDVLLPRKSGLTACIEMMESELGRTVPIVLMSAYYRSREQVAEHAPQLEVDAFLPKPFDLDDLLQQVQQLLA